MNRRAFKIGKEHGSCSPDSAVRTRSCASSGWTGWSSRLAFRLGHWTLSLPSTRRAT